VAVDKCDVSLVHLAAREHLAEFEVSGVVAGNDDEAAGLLVEAVDDAGAERASGG
jgi:hypothetical protein